MGMRIQLRQGESVTVGEVTITNSNKRNFRAYLTVDAPKNQCIKVNRDENRPDPGQLLSPERQQRAAMDKFKR